MSRPKLLDLFCGAGGAAMGYDRAGFEVVGVDVEPQPHFPFEFRQADALDVLGLLTGGGPLPDWLRGIDGIHLSPVCLTFARVTDWRGSRGNHPDTLTPSLSLLEKIAVPWVAENVLEACPPLRPDLILCGTQFGLKIQRHRAFQLGNWQMYDLMPACDHRGVLPFMHKNERAFADAMGCTWMPNRRARQAVPPPYTEYIGERLLEHLTAREAA